MKHKKLLSLSLSALLCLNPLTAYADSEIVDESTEMFNVVDEEIEFIDNDVEIDEIDKVNENIIELIETEEVANSVEITEELGDADEIVSTEEVENVEVIEDEEVFDLDNSEIIEELNDDMPIEVVKLDNSINDANLEILMRLHFENDSSENEFNDASIYEDYYVNGEYGVIPYVWNVTIPSEWCNVETLTSNVQVRFSFYGDNVSGWYPVITVSDNFGNELTYDNVKYPLITTRNMGRVIGRNVNYTVQFGNNVNNSYDIGVYQGWDRIHTKQHEHNFNVIIEEPTCDKNGSYDSIYCNECGTMIDGNNLIPALGHNYNQYIENDDETHIVVCEHNNSHTIEEEHKYSDWKIVKNATLAENGEKERICELCNHKQIETINAIGYTIKYLTKDKVVIETKNKVFDISEENLNQLAPSAPTYDGYKFIGWECGKPNGTGLLQVVATYKPIRMCTIGWYDEDLVLLESNSFDEDEGEPSYTKELPIKESDSKYDYEFNKWVKEDLGNDDDISYIATYTSIPKKFSYTITHEYYTDGILDRFESNSNNAEVDSIISETEIIRNPIYDGNTYKYISITPSTLQIQPMPSLNEFVLRYDRYSYRVIHKYLNEDGDLDGEAEEVFYALEDDKIDVSILQQPLYNDELYTYKEDSGNLTISTTKDSNVITIIYQKEKQLPKETSYLIKWMDTDGNELKSEVREGFIDDIKTPLDEDYKLDGYTFVETQDNILSISLKEDESENILKLYFEKDKPIVSEEPSVSPSVEPSDSPKPSDKPSETPIVSESPSPSPSNEPEVSESPEPSDSPKPSESPVVSESPSPSPNVEPSDSPKPSDKPIVSEQPSKSPVVSEKPSESLKPSETPTVSKSPTVSEKPSVSPTPTVSSTPNSTPNEDKVETPTPSTVDIPSTEVPKTSIPKKETTTIADPNMPLSATPTKTADELDFWIVLSISTFGLLLFLYNRKKY